MIGLLPFPLMVVLIEWNWNAAVGISVTMSDSINRRHPKKFWHRVHPARLVLWSFWPQYKGYVVAILAGAAADWVFLPQSPQATQSQWSLRWPLHTLSMTVAGGVIAQDLHVVGPEVATWFNLDFTR
jgi:hypothetical protein